MSAEKYVYMTTPILDRNTVDALTTMAEGDAGFVHDLMLTYLEQADQLLRGAIVATYAKDDQMFLRAIHALGGSSRSVGLARLAEACTSAEASIRTNAGEPLRVLLERVAHEYRSAQVAAADVCSTILFSVAEPGGEMAACGGGW